MELINTLITWVIILIGVGAIWWKLEKMATPRPRAVSKQPKPGECPHSSSKSLKVTSMGDSEDYYLCKLCDKKVKASELYYFERGGL